MPESLKELPGDVQSEKLILGAILSGAEFSPVADIISSEDFSLESSKRIFSRMQDLHSKGIPIDRVTIANALLTYGQLHSIRNGDQGGLAYLADLSSTPALPNLKSYCQIVKTKSIERATIFNAQKTIDSILLGQSDIGLTLSRLNADAFALQQRLDSDSKTIYTMEDILVKEGPEVFTPWDVSPGLPTGFPKLDDKIGGLQPAKVIGISAESSVGKTAFAGNIALNLIAAGHPVLFFAGEMTRVQLLHRFASAHSGISFVKFRRGWLKDDERKLFYRAINEIGQMPLYIDDTNPLSIHELETRTVRMVRDKGVAAVIADFIQIMEMKESGNGIKFRDERDALTYISGRLVYICKKLNIPFIYLSQFSRAKTGRDKSDRRPKLSDLFGASAIGNNSHIVMAIYREEFDKPNNVELKNTAELILLKNRDGERGSINLSLNAPCMKFYETPKSDADEAAQ